MTCVGKNVFFCVTLRRLSCCAADIDDCLQNEDCDCLDINGVYTCQCITGYTGNGTVCLGKLIINPIALP